MNMTGKSIGPILDPLTMIAWDTWAVHWFVDLVWLLVSMALVILNLPHDFSTRTKRTRAWWHAWLQGSLLKQQMLVYLPSCNITIFEIKKRVGETFPIQHYDWWIPLGSRYQLCSRKSSSVCLVAMRHPAKPEAEHRSKTAVSTSKNNKSPSQKYYWHLHEPSSRSALPPKTLVAPDVACNRYN